MAQQATYHQPIKELFQLIYSKEQSKPQILGKICSDACCLQQSLETNSDLAEKAISQFFLSLKDLPPKHYYSALCHLHPSQLLTLDQFLILCLALYLEKKLYPKQLSKLLSFFWTWNFQRKKEELSQALSKALEEDACLSDIEEILPYMKTESAWSALIKKSKIDLRNKCSNETKRSYYYTQLAIRQDLPFNKEALCPSFPFLKDQDRKQLQYTILIDLSPTKHYKDSKLASIFEKLSAFAQSPLSIELRLDGIKDLGSASKKALAKLPNISSITLQQSSIEEDFLEEALTTSMPALKELHIQGLATFSERLVKMISCAKNLRLLDLSGAKVDDRAIRQIAQNGRTALASLNLSGCKQITSLSLPQLSLMAPNLEQLNISSSQIRINSSLVGHLPKKLSELHLDWLRGVDSQFVDALFKEQKNLKSFSCRHCQEFDGKSLRSILSSHKQLSFNQLDISFCNLDCGSIEDFFLDKRLNLESLHTLGIQNYLLSKKTIETLFRVPLRKISLDYLGNSLFFKKESSSLKELKEVFVRSASCLSIEEHERFFAETPLTTLQIEDLHQLTRQDELVLAESRSLQHLSISGRHDKTTLIEGGLESLEALVQLRSLELALVRGIEIKALQKLISALKSLSHLTLGPLPGITGEQILSLKKKLPYLQVRTYGMQLKGSAPEKRTISEQESFSAPR